MKVFSRTCFCWLLLLSGTALAADGLNDDERRMVEWIDAHAEEAIELLAETVNIPSGTMSHEGVREVGRVMRRELDSLGLETEWIDMPPEVNRAGHLFGRKDGKGRRFLLIGHLDTVFEASDGFDAFERDGNTGRGPGVDDMKSGNVIIVYALKALREIGALDDLGIVVAYSGDEEKAGLPLDVSRKDLIEAGRWADVALGFESAVTREGSDWATIARRSSSNFEIEVRGMRAHSAGVFSDRVGAGAVYELARILDSFYGEIRGEYGLTFNVGTILGGTSVEYDADRNEGEAFGKRNVVPQVAVAHGGIRTVTEEQLQRTRERMQAIVANNLPRTTASIRFWDRYPSMAPTDGNRQLAEQLSRINEALGRGPMKVLDPLRRGAADISFVAPYADCLAGLGALGSGGHTPNESLDLDSLALGTKRAALLIYRLAAAHRND